VEKKNLGIIQIILGGLLLLGLFMIGGTIPNFLDDAQIPSSFAGLILILLGIQNISQAKFWQSNITKGIIILLIAIGIYNCLSEGLPMFIFFIILLFEQVYSITPFIKSKTLGGIELTAFILICLISVIFVVDKIIFSITPAGFSDDAMMSFFAWGGYKIILEVIIISIALIVNATFNLKKKES